VENVTFFNAEDVRVKNQSNLIFLLTKMVTVNAPVLSLLELHFRPKRSRSFLSAPRISTSGRVQYRMSAIHGLPVTLRLLRVKSDKSDWFQSHSIVFVKPIRTGISLDLSRGRDSWW